MRHQQQDDNGTFLGASTLVVKGVTELELMEAVACRKALALASDLGLQRLRITSGCLNLMKSIRGAGMGPYGQII